MSGLESFTFASPLALSALLILPIIWQFLKATPPKPTLIPFPAVRLLQELKSERIIAAKTPWWLLLLRSLIIIALIIAMARPILNQNTLNLDGSDHLVIFVDNDWSVIDRWQDRRDEMDKLLRKASQDGKKALIVTTADRGALRLATAQEALEYGATLSARPWPALRQDRLEQAEKIMGDIEGKIQIFWISNGLDLGEDTQSFNERLSAWGQLTIIQDGEDALPSVIRNVQRSPDGLLVGLDSLSATLAVQVLDTQANVLFERTLSPKDTPDILLELPVELKSRAQTLRIANLSTPASQYLLDERWRDKSVGIIQSENKKNDLLDPAYYIRKSLQPYAPLREEALDDLLERKPALIIDIGATSRTTVQQDQLSEWVKKGGILVQFASSQFNAQLSQYEHNLMPVRLSKNERTLGGALSWKRPAQLTNFPAHSPFHYLDAPPDVKITKQVLAQPDANLDKYAWARLQDGTPLITGRSFGNGWSVMFHVTATPEWSNLPLSGIFERMLVQLLTLSNGTQDNAPNQKLNAYKVFDSFGSLVPPRGNALAIEANELPQIKPNADHPPGLYGPNNALRALNLGPSLPPLTPLELGNNDAQVRGFEVLQETSLTPWFLFAALCMAMIDWLVTMTWLRKVPLAACLMALSILSPLSADAKSELDLEKALAAANEMRLAYMVSHDEKIDSDTRLGLDGLAAVLRRRTAVELGPTMAYDPEKDDPFLYPMIYWPIGESQPLLSDQAAQKLNRFLDKGGFLLVDTMGRVQTDRLRELTQDINIGPLQTINANHVLTRSFYLLNKFPGRYNNSDVWVEASENQSRDRVSSVLIGSNGWAQGWARDPSLRPIYPVIPGGEIQREQSYRFGVNLVMYILSGNYKGDQVHLPAILQRLGL